jgi:uncharacterized protein (DUF2062 family)
MSGGRWQLFFTVASAISVINSIVGGSGVAILAGVTLGLPLGVAAVAGFAFAGGSLLLHVRYDQRRHVEAAQQVQPLFPTPSS